ncbi:MAG: BatA domain-containing protein [Planctomycetes bacterium]|nr:BatA domain-containing protein [Planctomycetota bacterium]
MLALAFLNPLLLWALPLAAVPIVIHLLNRRRFQRVPWAAMEFLLAAMKRNRKRLRMEQWLVLLLRTLAVLLLVSLVARPQLGGGGLIGTRTHHLVLLDDSASMTQRSGSTTLFDRAIDKVRALADDLATRRDGDLFSVVRSSRAATPDLWTARVGPELGRRVGALLKEFVVGDGAPDLGQALGQNVQRAAQVAEAGRTEFYVIADQRARDWATDDDKAKPSVLAALQAMRADREHLTVFGVGGQHQNLAIVDIRLIDRLAVAAVPVQVAIDVQNHGLDATAPTTVAFEVDGKSRVVRPVPQLAPGERVAIPIAHTFAQPGFHRLEAQLEATDLFLLDDRRALALEVRDRSRVLLVDGQPDEDEGEVFFLQSAFEPGGEALSGIEVQVVHEPAFAEIDLEPFDLVWLANVQSPAPTAVPRLEAFVAAGGGLVLSVGALVDVGRWNELLWRDGKGVLPLPLGDIAGDPDRPEHALLVAKDHPICGSLAEVLELLTGNVLLIRRWLTLVEGPSTAGGAAVVARIRDAEGPPLLATRTYGSGGGEVALWSVTADKFWSNLPSTDLLLVFANQLHKFAARRRDPSPHNLLPEGSFKASIDPGTFRPDITVRSLAGDGYEQTFTALEAPVAPVAPEGGAPAKTAGGHQPLQLTVPMADLRQLGAYDVDLARHDGTVEKRMFARNAPPAESRLVAFPDAAFARLYPADLQARVSFLGEGGGLGTAGGAGELWKALAVALLVGLLLETLLAWRFGRR